MLSMNFVGLGICVIKDAPEKFKPTAISPRTRQGNGLQMRLDLITMDRGLVTMVSKRRLAHGRLAPNPACPAVDWIGRRQRRRGEPTLRRRKSHGPSARTKTWNESRLNHDRPNDHDL
jgi:hypothetical protein